MKINLDQVSDLTPKPKTRGASKRKERKEKPQKPSKPLYICEQVIYHLIQENGS